jgi:trimeric autotransporter adhesin
MATTERSLGWATGVASTDGATTYDSSRMSAFERSGLGVGVLLTGSYLAMSGATTTTLTVADGSAIVGGYFYESNGNVTISTSALGSGTFSVVIIANTAAGSQTVTANGAGTTTVTTATTRIALVTAGQLSTITTSITATNIVTLGTVTTSAGTITSITSYYPYATARQQSSTQYIYAAGGTAGAMPALTYTALTNYAVGVSSTDRTMIFSTSNGQVSLYQSGLYNFDFSITYDSNATGNRLALIQNLGLGFPIVSAALYATSSVYRGSVTVPITVTLGSYNTYFLQAWASVASRFVTDSQLTVTRL